MKIFSLLLLLLSSTLLAQDARPVMPSLITGGDELFDADVKQFDGENRFLVESRSSSTENSPSIVKFQDFRYDAFGRGRVSQPNTIFESSFNAGLDTVRYFDVALVGGGTQTMPSTEPSMKLTVTAASGDKTTASTRRRVQYFKSNSQQVFVTGRFNALKAGLVQRLGYFSSDDGLFFEMDGLTPEVVRRSSVGGSIVDTAVPQSSWNVDTMDGSNDSNNPCNCTFDPTRQQVLIIEFGWLGSLGVRYSIQNGFRRVLVHQMDFANILDVPFMYSGFNKITAEIENIGATDGTSSMFFTCSSVQSEGETAHPGTLRVVDTGVTTISISGVDKVAAGIRINSSFLKRSSVRPVSFNVVPVSGNNQVYFKIVYNPILTGATWVQHSEGIVDVLTNNPAYSGGSIVDSGFLDSNNRSQSTLSFDTEVLGDVYIGSDISNSPDSLILVLRTLSGTGSVLYTSKFREFY